MSHVRSTAEPGVVGRFFDYSQHFRAKQRLVISRIKTEQDFVDSHHLVQASLALSRAVASRVTSLIRARSISRFLRPSAVSLEFCWYRDVSACREPATHPLARSRRSAPKSVPVLKRIRPSVSDSMSFISA